MATGIDVLGKFEGFAFVEELFDYGGGDHDFHGRYAAFAGGKGEKALADDALERHAHFHADLRVEVGGEVVDDALDGLNGVDGVEGTENQVAGFCGGDGGGDGFQVAHFADEYDVGALAKNVFEGIAETLGVEADLALADKGGFILVEKLDWVFHGDDVATPDIVDVVDHSSEGCRLAAAGGAGYENESAAAIGEIAYCDGKVKIGETEVGVLDGTEDEGKAAALAHDIDAETADSTHADGKVHLGSALELGRLLGVHQFHCDFLGVIHGELGVIEHVDFTVDAHAWALAGFQKKIGCAALHLLLEEIV